MTTRVKATYEVRIDLDGNRLFTDASGDVSAYVTEIAEITHGMRQPGDRIGQPAKLKLTLDNTTGLFSPEGGSALAGFEQGRAIRVRMTYDSVTVDLYKGRIDHIEPEPGQHSRQRTLIECDGFWEELRRREVLVGLQEDKTYDQIVTAILDNLTVYPATTPAWFLGVPGFSELGVTTLLGGGASDYAVLDAGIHTFNYAGDNWRDGVSVHRALIDTLLTECGWIYEDSDGKLHAWSRYHLFTDMLNAVDATLTDADMVEVDYEYGETVLNAIEISYFPREVGQSTTDTLGTLTAPVRIPAGRAVDVTIRFDDGSGNRISGRNAITPVAVTDYQANRDSHGGGNDLTSSVACTMTAYAEKALLTFTNQSNQDAFIVAGARVRGQKIVDFGERVVTATDPSSIFSYGYRSNKLSLRMLDDHTYAQSLADWVIRTYKDPVGSLRRISFFAESSHGLMVQARDRRIGDRVMLSEGHTGASGEYFIVGIGRRRIRPHRHRVQWVLEPAPAESFWMLGVTGYGELGQNTVLGA